MCISDAPIILPDDPAALKAMIVHFQVENAQIAAESIRVQADIDKMSATLRAHEALVQALRIQNARLKKQKFGASSELIEREIPSRAIAPQHAAGQCNSLNWRLSIWRLPGRHPSARLHPMTTPL